MLEVSGEKHLLKYCGCSEEGVRWSMRVLPMIDKFKSTLFNPLPLVLMGSASIDITAWANRILEERRRKGVQMSYWHHPSISPEALRKTEVLACKLEVSSSEKKFKTDTTFLTYFRTDPEKNVGFCLLMWLHSMGILLMASPCYSNINTFFCATVPATASTG